MKKKEIREIYKTKRIGLSAVQKEKMNDLMLIQFQRLKIDIPGLIMTYAAIEKFNEFDPQLITDYCFFKNPDQVLDLIGITLLTNMKTYSLSASLAAAVFFVLLA